MIKKNSGIKPLPLQKPAAVATPTPAKTPKADSAPTKALLKPKAVAPKQETPPVVEQDTLPWVETGVAIPAVEVGETVAQDVNYKQVSATVTKQYKDGSSTEDQEPLGTIIVPEPHATVGLAVGITRNLGNYESLKMTVSLFVPCKVDQEEIDQTYLEVKGWVDQRVEQLNEEVTNELGGN